MLSIRGYSISELRESHFWVFRTCHLSGRDRFSGTRLPQNQIPFPSPHSESMFDSLSGDCHPSHPLDPRPLDVSRRDFKPVLLRVVASVVEWTSAVLGLRLGHKTNSASHHPLRHTFPTAFPNSEAIPSRKWELSPSRDLPTRSLDKWNFIGLNQPTLSRFQVSCLVTRGGGTVGGKSVIWIAVRMRWGRKVGDAFRAATTRFTPTLSHSAPTLTATPDSSHHTTSPPIACGTTDPQIHRSVSFLRHRSQ